jgi:2',3'-cyclic-nucleotide 2'-phosphodiesterase/3'-nucleotidase
MSQVHFQGSEGDLVGVGIGGIIAPFIMRPTVCLVGVLVLLVAAATHGARSADRQRMTILHTSDLHGQVLPHDDTRDAAYPGSLAQVMTLVEQVRAEVEGPVLVLDSGDTIQGSPFEQFAHVRWGRPSPTIEAMNRIGFAAMAVGNHEFNFGLDVLRRAERQAAFPFLSANTVDETTGEPAFPPYLVLEAGQVRIGVLGLTTPNIPGWEQPDNYRGLSFEPMVSAARRWVRVLRDEEHCDLVVVIAHTGFERDPDTGEPDETAYENSGWRLTQVPDIDLLLTGHSHDNIPPRDLRGVIVSQPRARARVLTRIDLELERRADRWVVADWRGDNLETGSTPPEESLVAAFASLHDEVVEALEAPIGTVAHPVTVRGCRIADCAPVDLIHAVQLEASGAELSLASLLTDRTPDLEPGPVSWRWVHALYVYPNTLVAVSVTGVQVKEILEHAARYYDGLDCRPGAGCTLLTDPAIRHYNVDNLAGLSYRIDPARPEGDRVRDLRYQGLQLDLYQEFKLVCTNYRAAGGGRFPHLADAEVVWKSSREVTDLIGEYVARNDPWRPTVDANWWVGPEVVAERMTAASGG